MSTSRVKGDVEGLRALVEEQGRILAEQRRRIEELEQHGSDHQTSPNGRGHGNGESRHSRRDLLRLAGLAAAGAAGAAGATALSSLPAAAANNSNFVLGVANDADATTSLAPTTTTPAGSAEGSQLAIDSGKAGAVTATATFFRAIHAISPKAAATISGVGVWGSSPDGAGVIGSSMTGVDLWAFNTGRFLQSTQPAGLPTYQGGVFDPTNGWTDLELIRDINGVVWVFVPPSVNGANQPPSGTVAGTWFPLMLGGLGVGTVANHPDSQGVIFSAVSNSLLALSNSDGATFQDMMVDTANGVPATPPQLVLTVTPAFNCVALITGSADLYTAQAGFNQDIGIFVSPSDPSNPPNNSQNIEAWKESGGFAGTNSPNAAFVQTLFNMTRGTTYNIRLKWKANKNAAGATIRAGAGPFGSSSLATNVSPTRLTVLLLASGA